MLRGLWGVRGEVRRGMGIGREESDHGKEFGWWGSRKGVVKREEREREREREREKHENKTYRYSNCAKE